MSIYDLTDKVMKNFGEDLALQMTDTETASEAVEIIHVIKHDVLNKEIYGAVTLKGKTTYYHVEDGNNSGTVFHKLSDEPIEVPKTRTITVAKIVPLVETPLSLAKAKALQPMLDEMQRSINYDKYVTGGSDYTTDYWKKKVAGIKGKIVYEEIVIAA